MIQLQFRNLTTKGYKIHTNNTHTLRGQHTYHTQDKKLRPVASCRASEAVISDGAELRSFYQTITASLRSEMTVLTRSLQKWICSFFYVVTVDSRANHFL